MNNLNLNPAPCPSTCCEELEADQLRIYKGIDTPLMKVCIDGPVTDADSIQCRLIKTCLTTAEEIAHLKCCSLKLERQLACQIPHYSSKITQKSHVQYSGPVRAKQACIQYDGYNDMIINYELFYVPFEDQSD